MLLGGLVATLFNVLVGKRNAMREGWSGIEVQLKRRHDLVQALVGVTALLVQVVSFWKQRSWHQFVFMGLFALPFLAGEVFALVALVHVTSP